MTSTYFITDYCVHGNYLRTCETLRSTVYVLFFWSFWNFTDYNLKLNLNWGSQEPSILKEMLDIDVLDLLVEFFIFQNFHPLLEWYFASPIKRIIILLKYKSLPHFVYCLLNFADEAAVCEKLNHLGTLDAVSNSEDPQACTLYAHNIYDTNRVIEVCVGIVKFS